MNAIRVLHVIPSLSLKHGGPSTAMPLLARALSDAGLDVTVATTDDDGPGRHKKVLLATEIQTRCGVTEIYFRKTTEFYKFSWSLTVWLWRNISRFDVVHIHALFSYASVVTAFMARSKRVPYVIRPLGVLNEWGMKHRRRILKMISVRVLEARILRHAAAVHYTSPDEKRQAERSVSNLGSCRAAIIPLPVETDSGERSENTESFFAKFPSARNQRIILFLSRIHPKKGIELLLEAFAKIHSEINPTVLIIAGEGEDGYVSMLKRKCVEMNITDQTIWTGFLEGEIKSAAFNAATVFVLPSYSENFGIAAAEALACGIPTVLTNGVAIAETVATANAGVVVPPAPDAIAREIRDLLNDPDRRDTLAMNARKLAKSHFSTAFVGQALRSLYGEMVAKRSREVQRI